MVTPTRGVYPQYEMCLHFPMCTCPSMYDQPESVARCLTLSCKPLPFPPPQPLGGCLRPLMFPVCALSPAWSNNAGSSKLQTLQILHRGVSTTQTGISLLISSLSLYNVTLILCQGNPIQLLGYIKDLCYGLQGPVPRKYMLKPQPQWDGIWMWGF